MNARSDLLIPVPFSKDIGLRGKNGLWYYAYSGPSMYPTLRPLDLMEIQTSPTTSYQVGDVVLFPSPDFDGNVVHRIIAKINGSFATQGDNNSDQDAGLLSPGQITGRVKAIWRNSRRHVIPRGSSGYLQFHFHQVTRRMRVHLNNMIAKPYHILAQNKVLAHWCHPWMAIHIVRYENRSGAIFRLYLYRKVIGYYQPPMKGWVILPPYRLFVDETQLSLPSFSGLTDQQDG